jgi:hypothetical protein
VELVRTTLTFPKQALVVCFLIESKALLDRTMDSINTDNHFESARPRSGHLGQMCRHHSWRQSLEV